MTKRDNLLKWTQGVPLAEQAPPLAASTVEETNQRAGKIVRVRDRLKNLSILVVPMAASSWSILLRPTHGQFLPPSSNPLDFRSFYPLLPCWQYPPGKPSQ